MSMRAIWIVAVLLGFALEFALAGPASAQVPELAQPQATAVQPDAVQAPPPAAAGRPALTRADLEAWLDGYMPYALQTGDIAGAVVVVVKDGEVLLQKGYGYADLAKRTPVDPAKHLFRPGSISKLFTWTAVMQLVEQGKLDLDADLNQYIDFEIPPRDGKPATLRQVMTHTAGFEEQIRGLISSNPDEIVPLGEALKRWVPERIH
jgi:CubicO group peptidase (beta-lactamase class C family)